MRYLLHLFTALAIATASLAFAPPARANGRFPQSNAIFFAPNDPQLVLLRTSFGLLVSRDRGKAWGWVCERSLGLANQEDPMYAVTPNGVVLGSTFQGLTVSPDQMCNFAFAGGEATDLVFIDLATRPSAPGNVVAFAASYDGQDEDSGAIFFKSTLFETKDDGKTVTPLGPSFERSLLGETVDLTESDPERVYVSTIRNPGTKVTASLHTSRDRGKTFEEYPFPLIAPERAMFIAAVDQTNADRVYVRTSNAIDMPSRLLVSDDAGKTFRTIFTGKGPLAGFALSPDGSKVWVGGPLDGLHLASTTDFAFGQKSTIEVQCLAFGKDGLWACSSEKSGFVAGLSTDEGATFEAKLHFCDIRGPLACAPGSTTHTECTLGGTASNAFPPWPVQQSILGCGPDPFDAGADAAGDASTTADDPGSKNGCGCTTPSFTPTPIAALLAGGAITAMLVRRRRRRSR